MNIGNIEWPRLLADITAKRDALNQVIETLTTHFVKDRAELEEAPAPAACRVGRKPGPKPGRRKTAAKPTRRARPQPAAASNGAASGVVGARDAAILQELKKGPRQSAALTSVLPIEPGQDGDQRDRACSNALTRLRLKKAIRLTAAGAWELVA